MNHFAALLCFVFAVVFSLSAAAESCKDSPQVIDACFSVHGRLRQGIVGPPTVRIWPVGTKRLLGVSEDWLGKPRNWEGLATSYGEDVYADFVVCPFTPEKAGEMQMVCIEDWSNVVTDKESQ